MLVIFFIFCQTIWIETTQNDFRDGFFEANLYASKRSGGTVEFTSRWDLNNDGYIDIVITNEQADYSYVYWGSDSGYSPDNRTDYPVGGSEGCEAGDINLDRFPELIFTDPDGLIRVFKGSYAGPNPNNYYDLPVLAWNEACYLGDFDKDGYLDIALSRFTSNYGAVLHGDSFEIFNRIDSFPSNDGLNNLEAADFNKDGLLDLVDPCGAPGLCYVYWGTPIGYIPSQHEGLPLPAGSPRGSSVADLNNDGQLEIILTIWTTGNKSYIYSFHDSLNTFILWDSLTPGRCFGGSAVADFNDDDYLDILFVKGYSVIEKPYIYWGSATGYSDGNRTEIGIDVNGSANLVADFNTDGYLDILIGNYSVGSNDYITYGPGYGSSVTLLPNVRDNCSRFREIGNVYDRTYREDYISSVYDANEIANWGTVEWDDSLPTGSAISFNIRTGNTLYPDTQWSEWITLSDGDSIPDSLNARFAQYKAVFSYADPCFLPCLYETRISIGEAAVKEHQYHQITRPEVHIAPNPAVGCVNIDCYFMKEGEDITLRIYNNSGQRVASMREKNHGKERYSFSWSGRDDNGRKLPPGVYFVEVRQSESYLRKKIILLVQ